MIDVGERINLLKSAFGSVEAARDGINFAFPCPNCKPEKDKRKLVIKIDTGQWHCWVCEIRGRTIPGLLRKYSPKKFDEWCKKFEKNERRLLFIDDENKKEEEPVELPKAKTIDELLESSDPDARAIISYLESRGVDENLAYKFRILGCTSGRLCRRVIIPSFDSQGKLNYWTSRSIEKDAKFKYVNPRVDRKTIVFNEVDIDWSTEVFLVEGPFDMIKAGDNVIPLLGSTLPNDSLLLRRIVENRTPVTIALDHDAIAKSHKIAKLLYQFDICVKFIEVPTSRDIGDMNYEEFLDLKKKAFEWNPINRLMYKIQNIHSGSIF